MKKIFNYKEFRLTENMNLAKSIVDKKMQDFEKLKEILSKNLGYIGKFTEYLFKEDINIEDLETLYNNLIDLRQNGSSLDIQNMDFESVMDKIQEENEDIEIKRFINQFPSQQKKILKEGFKKEKSTLKNIILKIIKKDTEPFISKISRYKTYEQLVNAMRLFAKDSTNDRETVKKNVKESKNTSIAFEKDDILVIHIGAFSDIGTFGSDTSWCILSESMFRRYTNNGKKQFILYDFTKPEFDPDLKIGITLEPNGSVYTAHNILDKLATDKVNKLKIQYDINTSDIYKKTIKEYDPTEIKLSTSTSMKKWIEVIPSLNKEDIKKWFSKIIDWSKNNDFKYKVLSAMVTYYFSDKQYVLKSDLDELNPNAKHYTNNIENKLIDTSKNQITLYKNNITSIISAIDDGTLTSHDIANKLNIFDSASSLIKVDDFMRRDVNVRLDDMAEQVSDRLNKIFNDEDVTYEKIMPDRGGEQSIYRIMNEKGFRLSRGFECLVVILNMALKRDMSKIGGNVAKYHDKILNDEKNHGFLVKYYPISNIEIDLDKVSIWAFNKGKAEYVKKKDYLGFKHYLSSRGASHLIEHLKDHKMEFKITRKSLNELRSTFNIESNLLREVVDEFKKKKRIMNGDIVEVGNLKLMVVK